MKFVIASACRLVSVAVVIGGAVAVAPSGALAYEADGGVVQTSGGTVVASCSTPNPAGVEASPTVSTQGVTVPPVTTPAIAVPPVTIGPEQVGPETVGPYTVGGVTIVPSQTVPGGTYGKESQADEVLGVGATNCAAVDVTNPGADPALAGQIRLQVNLEELNPENGQTSFVKWSEIDQALAPGSVTVPSLPPGIPQLPPGLQNFPPGGHCPPGKHCSPSESVQSAPVASGSTTDEESGVPGANTTDPHTGNVSLGLAQVYVGVPVQVNDVALPTGVGCQSGDFSCSTSAIFPVY